MAADTREELFAMADKLGVNRKWLQKEDTYLEHFDICMSKRRLAIKFGAIPVTRKELVHLLRRKKLCKQLHDTGEDQ